MEGVKKKKILTKKHTSEAKKKASKKKKNQRIFKNKLLQISKVQKRNERHPQSCYAQRFIKKKTRFQKPNRIASNKGNKNNKKILPLMNVESSGSPAYTP